MRKGDLSQRRLEEGPLKILLEKDNLNGAEFPRQEEPKIERKRLKSWTGKERFS